MESDISEVKEEALPIAEESSIIRLCFKSQEEANAYIRNYEISSHNKFVKSRQRTQFRSDLTSLHQHRLYFDLRNVTGGDKCFALSDGIPFANIAYEYRHCQYGQARERKRKNQMAEDAQGIIRKKRKVGPSKKLGCTATMRIKTILKFPDFYLNEEKLKSKWQQRSCLEKLRTTFCADTKRYILVYVVIDTVHNHVPKPELKMPKTVVHKMDKGCNRIKDEFVRPCERGPVLKRAANLIGKDLTVLAVHFKAAQELPTLLARPKVFLGLDSMDTHQLLTLYHEITGKVPNEMFVEANKEFTRENFLLLLHLCIVFANAAIDEQTHPSVRIKGTEHEFNPVECFEADCAITDLHMHCPLCPRTDSYSDVSLLKAHYTKQHINKAFEFAGLKILRCFDTCEVVSVQSVCKKFKGGHWHCYNCTNAATGRTECLIHFKKHLSDYASSFQIHVAKDVNHGYSSGTVTYEIENGDPSLRLETSIASNSLQYSPAKFVSGQSPPKRRYVDTGLGVHDPFNNSVLYVEEDELGNVLSTYTAQEIPTAGEESVVVTCNERTDVNQLKSRIRELEVQNRQLVRDSSVQKSLIEFLQKKEEAHKHENEELQAEIAMLKGETEDSFKPDNYDEVTSSIIRNAKSLTARACQKKTSIENKELSDPVSTVSDQLSGLKKEIEDLKSTLNGNFRTGVNLGAKPIAQNSPVYFIPNQRMMLPYQYMIPQNVTGLVNANPVGANQNVKIHQNTAVVSLPSSDTMQKLPHAPPVTTVASTEVLPDTETTDAVNTEKPSILSTSLDNINKSSTEIHTAKIPDITDALGSSDTFADASVSQDENGRDAFMDGSEPEITDSGDLEVENEPDISEMDESSEPAETIQVEFKKPDGTDLGLDIFEIPSSGAQASDMPETPSAGISSSDIDSLDEKEIFIATKLITEESESESQKETKDSLNSINTAISACASPSTTAGPLTAETSNTGVNDQTIKGSQTNAINSSSGVVSAQNMLQPTPLMFIPNQNLMNPFIPTQQNSNSLIMNSLQNTSAPETGGPYVLVQSQNGTFWIPKNKITGLDKVPGVITSTNISSLNMQTPVKGAIKKVTSVKELLLKEREITQTADLVNNQNVSQSKDSMVTVRVEPGIDLQNTEASETINGSLIDDGKADLACPVSSNTDYDVPLKAIKMLTRTLPEETNTNDSLASVDHQYIPPISSSIHTKELQKESTMKPLNKKQVNTRSLTEEPVKTAITNIRQVNTRSSTKGSLSSETLMKYSVFNISSSKESVGNSGTPVKCSVINISSSKESEAKGDLNKRQMITRSSGGDPTEEGSISLHSIVEVGKPGSEAALGSVHKETAHLLQSNKKNVVILKVKGNMTKKSLSDFLTKNQKRIKSVNNLESSVKRK